MFINHSCDPNCETEELKGEVWVMSLRKIAAGEELTYDYNLYDGDDDESPLLLRGKKMPKQHVLTRRAGKAQKGRCKKSHPEQTLCQKETSVDKILILN